MLKKRTGISGFKEDRMKKTFWSSCVLGSVMAVSISAQQAPATPAAPAAPTTPAAGAQMKSDAKPMTVSGCLQKGTAADTFTFTVIPAAAGSAPAAGAAPAAGMSAATGPYSVMAGTGVNLTPHAGHRVELTGTVAAASASTPAAPAGGASAAPAQTFHATALKMVAPSCTP
jgi:hypothetical protein